ncbi:PhaK-like protein [Stutzerimonas stutzeri]|nr:outer membrane porin [Stutzerimonas stutzeri DSM 4166]GBC58548.1 PhaK-like protein [Stutzerimonas stutzeri]
MTPRTPSSVALFAGGCMTLASLGFSTGVQAEGFIDDSTLSLNLRNFYINRNFVNPNAPLSKAEEWTQSFILNFQSGYTPGPIGFGVDALGLLSVKLDGGGGTYGTGLLPVHGAPGDRHPPDDFGRLAVAAKAKLSETEVRVGEWMVVLPILRSDDGRSLPQTFQGGMITSKEIKGLTLYGGQMRQNSPRDDGSMDDMFYAGVSSDRFNFAGGEYELGAKTKVGAWHARLEDIYQQNYFQLLHTQPLGEGMALTATSVTSPARKKAARWPVTWTTRPTPACSVCRWAAIPSTSACRKSAATMAGCASTAPAAAPWPTTRSTPATTMPTSAPGSCAMTTTSPAWVFRA